MNAPPAPHSSAGDRTRIGQILLAMGAIASDQTLLLRVAQRQAQSSEARLGAWLVTHGLISRRQLELAVSIQQGLRSRSRLRQALAQAALARESSDSVRRLAKAVKKRSTEVHRKTTGRGHPAVTADMLRTAAAAPKEDPDG